MAEARCCIGTWRGGAEPAGGCLAMVDGPQRSQAAGGASGGGPGRREWKGTGPGTFLAVLAARRLSRFLGGGPGGRDRRPDQGTQNVLDRDNIHDRVWLGLIEVHY